MLTNLSLGALVFLNSFLEVLFLPIPTEMSKKWVINCLRSSLRFVEYGSGTRRHFVLRFHVYFEAIFKFRSSFLFGLMLTQYPAGLHMLADWPFCVNVFTVKAKVVRTSGSARLLAHTLYHSSKPLGLLIILSWRETVHIRFWIRKSLRALMGSQSLMKMKVKRLMLSR